MASETTEQTRVQTVRSRLGADVRTRILASYVVLLSLAALISVLAVRQLLLVDLDDRIQADLAQEVQEFERLAGGVDPETGRPFGTDIDRIFEVFLARNVPGEGEELLTIPRTGRPRFRDSERAKFVISQAYVDRWRTLESVDRGEIETPVGPARYVAVPVVRGGRTLGTFVVANFIEGEREEVADAVRIVAIVALGVLLIGTGIAFLVSRPVLTPLRDLRDAAQSVSGADMTRRIEVEGSDDLAQLGRAFNRMLDRLEFAFASQRDFIRDVSHELRTPVAVMRGHLELLAEGSVATDRERRETITLVMGELDRITRFVDDLLLLAKTEQPDFLELETVDLADLCKRAVANSRALGDRDWRPDARSRRSIVADRERLTQAVMNLARNACEHTEPGDTITIGSSVDGDTARIWVEDSGEGIAAGEATRIFERFSRGRGRRRRNEGAGLGLAIVRAIAEAHGGRVELQSAPGRGARFELVLPVEPEGEMARVVIGA